MRTSIFFVRCHNKDMLKSNRPTCCLRNLSDFKDSKGIILSKNVIIVSTNTREERKR